MATPQERRDLQVEEALRDLKGFSLSPDFTTRGGYNVRVWRQPPPTEPFPDETNPERSQIYRIISGPGNAIYGDVQPDGTTTLKVRPRLQIGIDIAAAVSGYRDLLRHLDDSGLEYQPDQALGEALIGVE